jgi:hypothetical protein
MKHREYKFATKCMLLAIIALALSCGTLINGKKQTIQLQTNPPGATVFVAQKEIGVTPLKIELERAGIHVVTFKLKGHEEYDLVITKELSNWVWMNILLGGIVGIFVDDATGGAYLLTPENFTAEMQPSGKAGNMKPGVPMPLYARSEMQWQQVGHISKREAN